MNLRDQVASLIRTVTPVGVALLLQWGAEKGLTLPEEPMTSLLVGVAVTLYYAAVRVLEMRWPWIGWLLGYAVPPTYEKTAAGKS